MKLNFTSTKEKLPQHGEYILYIKTDRSLYHEDTPEPIFARCEWQWDDSDGSALCHDEEFSIENPPEDYPFLNIINGEGYTIWSNMTNKNNPEIENIWWMTQKEFNAVWKNAKH